MKRLCWVSIMTMFALFLLKTPSASADLWRIDAYEAGSESSAFWISFEDNDGDGIVSLAEYMEFSGVSIDRGMKTIMYDVITGIPYLQIPDSGTVPLTLNGTGTKWHFSSSPSNTDNYDPKVGIYSYTAVNTSDPTSPIPGTVLLLGSGLIAFIGLRRRFVRK